MELKKKVVSGFFWTASEKIGSMLMQVIVSVVLARLLDPSDFGLVGMLMVFSLVGTTIVDSGFSQALIQRRTATDTDYNSVFYLNLAIGVVLFLVLWALAVPIAGFYQTPFLSSIAPWLFLIIPLNALGIIQTTRLSATMRFGRLSGINFIASLTAGIVAIIMAIYGWGVWALVWQLVILTLIRTLFLWVMGNWRPGARFSWQSVGSLFGYGSRLFATGLISQAFNNLSQLIIGKFYSSAQLGYYYKSQQFKDMTANTVSHSIVTVSFPAFSTLQDDPGKLKDSARKVIKVLSFFLFPLMAGLIAVTDEVFPLALTHKWDPAIPYFKIFCLSAVCIPLSNISLNILKATGRSKLVLRLEIVKKIFALAVVIYAATVSVLAMVWAYLAWNLFELILNAVFAGRIMKYRFAEQVRDVAPYILLSVIMYAEVIWAGGMVAAYGPWVVLATKAATGIIIYSGLSAIVRPAAWNESLEIIKLYLGRKDK